MGVLWLVLVLCLVISLSLSFWTRPKRRNPSYTEGKKNGANHLGTFVGIVGVLLFLSPTIFPNIDNIELSIPLLGEGFGTLDGYSIIVCTLAFFVLWCVAKLLANRYVKTHRQELRDAASLLSQECSVLSFQIFDQYNEFCQCIDDMGLDQTYSCGNGVVANAERDPIKFLIKYAEIEYSEKCLERLDFCLNYVKAVDTFKARITQLRTALLKNLPATVRFFIDAYSLPFSVCCIDKSIMSQRTPAFVFSYVSPAGRSASSLPIEISTGVLKALEEEVSSKMTKKAHAKMQRSLMTNDLREAIKKRDNYTCQLCGNSVYLEPNLLLEVDHIIPVAKGGKTESSNLQTLCWRCNRAKSDDM